MNNKNTDYVKSLPAIIKIAQGMSEKYVDLGWEPPRLHPKTQII